jgi:hypothetical protein
VSAEGTVGRPVPPQWWRGSCRGQRTCRTRPGTLTTGSLIPRVETKIFVFVFSRKFSRKRKLKRKFSRNFWYTHILTRLFTIFWQKFSRQILQTLKLMQKCSRTHSRKRKFSRKLSGKRKFSRNEISRKLPHFRMIFAFCENEKKPFSFQPY